MKWRENAACVGQSLDLFFNDDPKTIRRTSLEAKQFCDSCQVRNDCLNYAIDNNIFVGIYGGLSNNQRRSIKRNSSNKLTPGRKVGNNYDFS